MKHDPILSGQRKPVNLTLDSGVVEAARATGKELARRWKEEHREALQSWARWMEENGSPLDRHRAF